MRSSYKISVVGHSDLCYVLFQASTVDPGGGGEDHQEVLVGV